MALYPGEPQNYLLDTNLRRTFQGTQHAIQDLDLNINSVDIGDHFIHRGIGYHARA